MYQPLFANISSHRNKEWQSGQKKAAKSIIGEEGRIIDIPFPRVHPNASESQVDQIAQDIAQAIGPTVKAAMVQGEYSLTLSLIRELEKYGVECYVAALESGYTKYQGQQLRRFVRFRKVSLNN